MRALLGWMLIALALAVSGGCASHGTGPAPAFATDDNRIWDCGWRSL